MPDTILDLIIHPVRLQILQLLTLRQMTTQEIGAALPDVPTSSLYRHLRQLLKSDLITVAESHQVRGIEEKVYALARSPHLIDPAQFAALTPEEHLHYFTMYAAALIQSFAGYVRHTPEVDYVTDRVGYTEALVWATPEEFDTFGAALNTALLPLMKQGPGAGRRLRKIGVIAHPVVWPAAEGEGEGPDDDTENKGT
ncbi:MAG: helix-turn-helix domain-containing protein [Anaerolineae bacterium]|nr:helix-turn-helix domain-containing protein [Anaerolineae bacterium]